MIKLIPVVLYVVLAPLIGGLLSGIDRKISARAQLRVGPPILQPFYDVIKLFSKQTIAVQPAQTFYLMTYMVLMIVTGAMFFAGLDLLMCFFVLSTAAVFLYFAACATRSPYSSLGSQRELIQQLAYEPAVLMTCVGFYLTTGSFDVSQVLESRYSNIIFMPGLFFAFVFILTIKMRKSPFDESTSHHPHQELVKGITSDMGARNLAIYQITEWYETVFLLGVVAMFVVNSNPISIVAAVIVALVVYFAEVLIDNTNARIRWDKMLWITWGVTILSAGINILILMLV